MAQTFTLDRHTDPLNPTAVPANNEKIKNYSTIADMESDLTNVDDGEVISTEEADYASIHVSDEVTDGDLNPVTSNAVYDAIEAAKIDRVKGAFVEERTNKLWTDGRPIYRQYVEGTPEPVMSNNRKSFIVYAPISSSGSSVKVIDMYGYWEITESTSYPALVGSTYIISSTAMMPNTPHNTSLSDMLVWDQRYPDRLSVGVSMNDQTSYGMSEHVKICAVIEYVKMSDTPVEDPGVGPLTPSSGNIAGVIVNDGVHYSTTEVPTGGTWIDGKPVYRVTVDTPWMTTYTESNNQRAYTYTTGLGMENIISVDGMIYYHTVNTPSNLGRTHFNQPIFFSTGSDVGLTSYASPASISIIEFSRWGGGLVDCKATVTYEYTKA